MSHHVQLEPPSGLEEASPRGVEAGVDERLHQLLDGSLACAALLTPDGVVKFVSQNTLELTGLAREDILGRLFWEAGCWAHDPHVRHQVQQAVREAGIGRVARLDAVLRTARNEQLTVDLQLSPVRDRAGQVIELVASAVDVSERVASQRRLEELVREISHRNKNLFTTVRAMSRMTQRASRPDTAFRDFTARLEAMDAAHDALDASHTAEEFFENLAHRLMRPYRITDASRITISGPKVRLDGEQAKMLALCLFELATNAIKYGALSNSDGRLTMVLSGPDADGQVSFAWTESGGPSIPPPARQGYGTQFVTSTLKSLFEGEVTIAYRPEGFRLTVTGPARSLFTGPSRP